MDTWRAKWNREAVKPPAEPASEILPADRPAEAVPEQPAISPVDQPDTREYFVAHSMPGETARDMTRPETVDFHAGTL